MSKAFKCHQCEKPITIESLIQSCKFSYQPQQWFWYESPCCQYICTVEIKSEIVKFGHIDGAPGPCFISEKSQRIPGLKFKVIQSGIILIFEGYEKNVPQK